MVKTVTFLACTTYLLIADVGCNVLIGEKNKTCQESTVLTQEKESLFESSLTEEPKIELEHNTINITEKLVSVDTQHLDHNITIERASTTVLSCPPFCIQPMKIEKIETVGELEVLAFIEKSQRKKHRLLIDVRTHQEYNNETIPGAINLPYKMLTKESPYQEAVLKILGAKKIKNGWLFKEPQQLLIFGESLFSPEAAKAIRQLVKLGYPKKKLFYYRGGITSWKVAGLTLI